MTTTIYIVTYHNPRNDSRMPIAAFSTEPRALDYIDGAPATYAGHYMMVPLTLDAIPTPEYP